MFYHCADPICGNKILLDLRMNPYYFIYSVFGVSRPNFENVLCSFTNRIKNKYYMERSLTVMLSTSSEMIICNPIEVN